MNKEKSILRMVSLATTTLMDCLHYGGSGTGCKCNIDILPLCKVVMVCTSTVQHYHSFGIMLHDECKSNIYSHFSSGGVFLKKDLALPLCSPAGSW